MIENTVYNECLVHSICLLNSHGIAIVELESSCWSLAMLGSMSLLPVAYLDMVGLSFTPLPGHPRTFIISHNVP